MHGATDDVTQIPGNYADGTQRYVLNTKDAMIPISAESPDETIKICSSSKRLMCDGQRQCPETKRSFLMIALVVFKST